MLKKKNKNDVPSAENTDLSKVPSFKPGADCNIALCASPADNNSEFLISAF